MAIVLRIMNKFKELDEKIEVLDDSAVTFGRSDSNDYVLDDGRCSGKHLEIDFTGGEIWARDLGSKNGTFVDRVQTNEERIYIGSQIIIGETKITLDSKMMTDIEKKRYTKKKLASKGGGRKVGDISLVDESVSFNITHGNINEIDDGDNDGKKGLKLPKGKKRY